ncbi:hypothetical protein AWC38_SpisGene14755 [Stylophora pistillata]|uniref:Uncharacterized protein n=1 Tax=Stylophora pistillata TaxID=50429 RepID=A0A2B4RWS0_STYPI|nr:hypothetical protein AWC38_SpisGene14755 [Stylophora pistillata]
MNVHDLPTADAIYHQTCNVNFRTNKQLPRVYEADELPVMKKRKIGRPQNEEKNQAFVKVTKFLEENDDEQITAGDLVENMKEYLYDTEIEDKQCTVVPGLPDEFAVSVIVSPYAQGGQRLLETIPEDTHSDTVILKLEDVQALFDKLMEKKVSANEASTAKALDNIEECVHRKQDILAERSRTAALWIQYLEMVDILRSFIRAERTASWELQLKALTRMLLYLAASDHNFQDCRGEDSIVDEYYGTLTTDYSFKRSAQAVTMASKSSVKIDNDQVQVDPQLLFQRLVIACDNSHLEALPQYELCTYPTALFDSPFMLRQPQKPALADALWTRLTPDAKTQAEGNVQYVLDEGALLNRVPWPRGSPTYKEVCNMYCTYVQRKYGRAIVMFDGYDEMSTKAMTQQRHASGKVAVTVTFTESMSVTMKKDNFLSNSKNKQCFLLMLSEALQNVGCVTQHANGDADLLIVQTAIESARTRTTILVGDDTDLLVLLCYHASEDGCDLYFRPEPKANARSSRAWHRKSQRTASSMRCICCKNGMQCAPACGQCKGTSCTNSLNTVDYESEDSED